MPRQDWKNRVPKRTQDIELWDENPVGNRGAWRRELLQFWSIMYARGLRQTQTSELRTLMAAGGGNPIIAQVAAALTRNINSDSDGAFVAHAVSKELQSWFEDSVLVPGERSKNGSTPSAGIGVPHYLGLVFYNRAAVRERYWAWFWYYALESDLQAAESLGLSDSAGAQLERYFSLGMSGEGAAPGESWELDTSTIAERSPETFVVVKGVIGPPNADSASPRLMLQQSLQQSGNGPREGTSRPGSPPFMDSFLCPGSVVLMRRSLRVLAEQQDTVGHAALSDVIESSLASHAAQYFVRGMRVLNELSARRSLPEDCASCWARFQPDVRPIAGEEAAKRVDRWRTDGYSGAATAEDAAWIDETCQTDTRLFVSLAGPDMTAAKDLAGMEVEGLRRQLADYTVNRIVLSIAHGVARRLATSFGEPTPSVDQVYASLDRWSKVDARLVAREWRDRIENGDGDGLRRDEAISDPEFREAIDGRLNDAAGDPAALEKLVREIVAEAVLSTRAFGRYRELLHSLLGGGSLPSNQDPKGMMANGGTQASRFYLTLNDGALEMMVAVASLESADQGVDLTFDGLLSFLDRRFHVSVDHGPSGDSIPPGLVAAASAQSRQALRDRLSSMGMLEEYSDSSQWNRVSWTKHA